MATFVREEDGSLRRLGPTEELTGEDLGRGFFMVDDGQLDEKRLLPVMPSPYEWPPDGWIELGVIDET